MTLAVMYLFSSTTSMLVSATVVNAENRHHLDWQPIKSLFGIPYNSILYPVTVLL